MDVLLNERVACLHVDIQHPLLLHFIYSTVLVHMYEYLCEMGAIIGRR